MKISEIQQHERTFYKVQNNISLDDDIEVALQSLEILRREFNQYGKSKSINIRKMVLSNLSNVMNKIKDIDDFCETMPDDKEAFDIRQKLYPIFNELEQMHSSIKL